MTVRCASSQGAARNRRGLGAAGPPGACSVGEELGHIAPRALHCVRGESRARGVWRRSLHAPGQALYCPSRSPPGVAPLLTVFARCVVQVMAFGTAASIATLSASTH